MNEWKKTSEARPPENVMITAILESGTEVTVMRRGNLYFPNGKEMYAYYVPVMWKLASK